MEQNLIQFIQGNAISDLTNTKIPGSIYFFKDGNIVWDHWDSESESAERTFMSGPVFSSKKNGIALHSGEWNNIDCLSQYADGTYIIQLKIISGTAKNDGIASFETTGFASGICSFCHGTNEGFRQEEIELHYAAQKNSVARLYAAINYNSDGTISLGLSTNVDYLGINTLQIKLQKVC